MKKILTIMLLFAFLAGVTNAGIVFGNEYYKKHIGVFRTASQNDPYRRHLTEVNAILFPATGDATVWYVNSNVTTEGDGTSWTNAFDTLNEGIGACSVGDFVDVAEGHNEAIIAADGIDADVAGITIRGYGSGTRMPTIDYDHADGEFVIGATSVTLFNLRFNASVTIVTHAIDIENAGDYARIIYCEFPDGEAAGTDEFVDTIQVGTTATDITIIGCNYFSTGTGSNNFVDLSAATIANATATDNTIYGAFAEAGIWAGAAVPTNVTVSYNTVTNTTSGQLGIEFAGNATGWMHDNLVSTDAIGTSYDPGRMSDSGNMWDDFDTYDTTAVPWTTNETGVNRWGVTELAQIEAEATDALEADHLDHLFAASVADEPVNDSFAADITTSGSDWSDFVASTDSLQAIADHVQTLITTGAGTGTAPTGVTNESIIAFLLAKGATATASTFNNTTDSLEAISDGLSGQGSSGRNSLLGTQVARGAADIFDGTTTSLFTIAGGRVLITHLSMQNSIAAADATANAVKFVMNPTVGDDTDMCATLDVADDTINCMYTITGTFGDALVQSGAATDGAVGAGMASQVILDAGTIDLSSAGDSGAGGSDVQTSVELWYFPLDAGATVVTAP